jgi:hypothetical protein
MNDHTMDDEDGEPPIVLTPELAWLWARNRAMKELEQAQAFGGLLLAQLRPLTRWGRTNDPD